MAALIQALRPSLDCECIPAGCQLQNGSSVDRGVIVSTRGRDVREGFTYSAHAAGTWRVPLVVLIDRDSASAAEIFAGAIRDHRRGTVVGQQSYGKGSVQSVMPLSGDRAIKLTTAYYYTPSGRSIHRTGIEPDITFDFENAVGDAALMDEALAILKGETPAEGLHARL